MPDQLIPEKSKSSIRSVKQDSILVINQNLVKEDTVLDLIFFLME